MNRVSRITASTFRAATTTVISVSDKNMLSVSKGFIFEEMVGFEYE